MPAAKSLALRSTVAPPLIRPPLLVHTCTRLPPACACAPEIKMLPRAGA